MSKVACLVTRRPGLFRKQLCLPLRAVPDPHIGPHLRSNHYSTPTQGKRRQLARFRLPQPAVPASRLQEQPPGSMESARSSWAQLRELDSLVVQVIVDNETDGLSSACDCCDPRVDPETRTVYTSEFTTEIQRLLSGKSKRDSLDFRRALFAGHGLSLLLTATPSSPSSSSQASDATAPGSIPGPLPHDGGAGPGAARDAAAAPGTGPAASRTLLFDGGPSCELWRINAERMEIDVGAIEGAVLSHWHVDHSVGLAEVARAVSRVRGGGGGGDGGDGGAADGGVAGEGASGSFVFDLHPDRPRRRGILQGQDKYVPFNEDVTLEELQQPGCLVSLSAQPHTVLGDTFFVSGEVPRVTPYEVGQPGHATQQEDDSWQLDPYIMDERYVAVKIRGKGAVVLSACSHAGIVNVVRHVKEVAQGPVFGVLGGLHLASSRMEGRIPDTVAGLRELDPHLVVAGHCTGWRAKAALLAAFPGRFQPCSVGGTYSFLADGVPAPGSGPPGRR